MSGDILNCPDAFWAVRMYFQDWFSEECNRMDPNLPGGNDINDGDDDDDDDVEGDDGDGDCGQVACVLPH